MVRKSPKLDFNLLDYNRANIIFADVNGILINGLPNLTTDEAYHTGWEIVTNATNRTVSTTQGALSDTVFTDHTTLSPIFQKKYTITLDANGGTPATESLTTNENATLDYLPTPTRSGYTFKGWYTTSTGGTKVTTSYIFESQTTLYAQWTQNSSGNSNNSNNSNGNNSNSSNGSSGYISSSVTSPTLKIGSEGTASVSPKRIENGSTGTVTITPKEGYKVSTITILDADKNEVKVTAQEDGTFKFTQPISKVTISVSFSGTGTTPVPDSNENNNGTGTFPEDLFYDVQPTDWYYDAVKFCLENGLMSGTGDGSFSSDGDMSRAMIVTVLYNLAGQPMPSQGTYFDDVSAVDYYYSASLWASQQGIVSGIGDNLFAPHMSITREQLFVILYQYAMTQTNLGYSYAGDASFVDFGSVNSWGKTGVNWCFSKGLINLRDDGRMYPQSPANRAEIASMLMTLSLLSE